MLKASLKVSGTSKLAGHSVQHLSYTVYTVEWYGDSVDNTAKENSSIYSLIRMRWLQSATACGQYNFAPTKSAVLNWRCRLMQVDLYNGRKMRW